MTARTDTLAKYDAALKKCETPDERRAVMRELALRDLFFLLVFVLKQDLINCEWGYDRCRDVQAEPDGYLDLWSREHYKSSIITFGLTIQNLMNDSELTVGIFSHVRSASRAFLRQIKQEFEGNETLRQLFPDVIWEDPKRQAPKWSEDDGITLKRQRNPKEASIEAWGVVDAQPTGKHFDICIYDDLVTRESVKTSHAVKNTMDAYELSLNLGKIGGVRRHIGTRYHARDAYGTMIKRGSVKTRIFAATKDGLTDGEPYLMTREALADKRRDQGQYTFACQMMNNPRLDTVEGFDEKWLEHWPVGHLRGLNLYAVFDPSSGKKQDTGDYTAAWVIGLGPDRNYRVVDMVRDRLALPQRGDLLFAWHRQYDLKGIGYEEYGLQSDLQYFEDRMAQENYKFRITPLGGKLAKSDRIKRLIPVFEQRRILLPFEVNKVDKVGDPHDLVADFVDEEYSMFPVASHDDMLDAMSRILDPDLRAVFPRVRRDGAPVQTTADSSYNELTW